MSNIAEISLVVKNNRMESNLDFLYLNKFFKKNWAYNLFNRLDKKLFWKSDDVFRKVNIEKLISCPVIKVIPERTKYSDIITKGDVSNIQKHSVDVFSRFGFRILRGDILDLPKCGIWSFHHGDNRIYRGGPPSFWEVFQNETITGVTLQILNEDLDGGIILERINSCTDFISPHKIKIIIIGRRLS